LPAPVKSTNGPTRIEIVVRDNSGDGWPDDMAHCWWAVENGVLRLCHEDGRDLDAGKWTYVLAPYEQPQPAAERLLKRRAGVSTEFNAPLRYPKTGMI
jgi:hypothetical protein